MHNINFKANLISNPTILKKKTDIKNTAKASFVEINPLEYSDIYSLKNIANLWRRRSSNTNFADDIYCSANNDYFLMNFFGNNRYFALTTQRQGFENLDPFEVLGLAQLRKIEDGHYLDFIKISPDEARGAEIAQFKHLGTTFIRCLQKLNDVEKITLAPLISLKDCFYSKLGFNDIPFTNKMIWLKKIL